MLPGERMIRKGDVVEFTSAIRIFGQTPDNSTNCGLTFSFGCPIAEDVTSVTVTQASNVTLILGYSKRVLTHSFPASSTTHTITGSVSSHEYGIVNLSMTYPAVSGQNLQTAVAAFPSATPTVFTFS